MPYDYNNKKVLITGGAGFIGSHLAKRLKKLEARVYVLEKPNVDLWRLKDFPEIGILELDSNNPGRLSELIQELDPNLVFNLLADIDVSRDFSLVEPMIKNNFLTTFEIINALRNSKSLDLFVTFGTCEEYGDSKVPFMEGQKEVPVSPYSLSKILSSYLAGYLGKIESFPIITIRPFLTYGPYQTNNQLIPYAIRSLIKGEKLKLTKMEQTRDFIYIDDLIEAVVNLPGHKINFGDIINLGSGKETQIRTILEKICQLTKREFQDYIDTSLPYRKGETMHFYSSIEKAKRLFGFNPRIDLDEGLKRTVEWYEQYIDSI